MTSRQVGDLARAGLLAVLGADTDASDVHPDQVAALARHHDLAHILDRHLCLGPEQAAIRLGVRRTELNELCRLAWLRPCRTVTITYSSFAAAPLPSTCTPGLDVAAVAGRGRGAFRSREHRRPASMTVFQSREERGSRDVNKATLRPKCCCVSKPQRL
ncbi:hypothetical protein OG897_30380 [Streptomyces sp. NBC_00237]|uniref:hypothetical protein n=1 Tax=Streptomyces sp. NBC_00237 TaxID=2975687 RepID=UPI002258137D|nr:hypothetical protein [Streptomyces sp. NBC_00237]MCX5205747.1 hypothetical protein [Streptomyces sp. NBC_00237]